MRIEINKKIESLEADKKILTEKLLEFYLVLFEEKKECSHPDVGITRIGDGVLVCSICNKYLGSDDDAANNKIDFLKTGVE